MTEDSILKIITRFQQFPENDLTKKIIIPLLEKIGYHKVEFFGGPSESGKDIVCWEFDRTGDLKLAVAQVKHFKFTNISGDTRSLRTIMTQLAECLEKRLPYTDKTMHLPAEVLLISTYPVNAKTLLTKFEGYPGLRDGRIKIIDAHKLALLSLTHIPKVVKELSGLELNISNVVAGMLNNDILLKALGYHKKKDIRNIYTDIDFSLGKRSTQLFFHTEFYPVTNSVPLTEQEVERLKEILKRVYHEFPFDSLSNQIKEKEVEFKKLKKEYDDWKDKHSPLMAEFVKLDTLIKHLKDTKGRRSDLKEANNRKARIQQLLEKIGVRASPRIRIDIDGEIIAAELKKHKKWIEQSVRKMNLKRPSTEDLRLFINQCKTILESASYLFNNHQFFSAIGYDFTRILRNDYETTRFKLPIQEIFDTGANLMVLGDAGAGKTTSLQMYVLNKNKNTQSLFIFLPLSNITQHWQSRSAELSVREKVASLDKAIATYLEFKGIAITPDQFAHEISEKRTILLLDGLDEAIKLNPWLPESIVHLANRYKNSVQLIVTSRMSGGYIDQIPFFSVTLLPFTPAQRNQFIRNWFEKKESRFVKRIIQHLKKNKEIAEIIKNPLLTTLLCVLAKNEITLPSTELMLYDDRLQLLTGYYDSVKNIDTRIVSKPQTLELVAQKLAFNLHLESKKDEDKLTLEKQAIGATANLLTAEDARLAVQELIDPCNVLVPTSDDGKFGFGHLKFQEHLAAREIHRNRNIEIVPILRENWWRSTFVFYAQMEPDLNWLIMETADKEQLTVSQNTLFEMITHLSVDLKKRFSDMVNKLMNAEKVRTVSSRTFPRAADDIHLDEEWR